MHILEHIGKNKIFNEFIYKNIVLRLSTTKDIKDINAA